MSKNRPVGDQAAAEETQNDTHPAETNTVAPLPKPGDAEYNWADHYGTDTDLYTHTFADGTVIALKTFASIYSKTWLYKIRDLDTDIDVQFAAIDRAACETAKQVLLGLDDTTGDPIDELWTAWSATSETRDGMTAGN